MPEKWIELPNGDCYPGAEAAAIAGWVEYVSSLVVLHPAHIDKLAAATRRLGELAQAQYPQLESGESVTLALSDLGDLLDGITFELADYYVGLTGTVLFTCQDGPKVGADLLADQITVIHDAASGGGEDGNGTDS